MSVLQTPHILHSSIVFLPCFYFPDWLPEAITTSDKQLMQETIYGGKLYSGDS